MSSDLGGDSFKKKFVELAKNTRAQLENAQAKLKIHGTVKANPVHGLFLGDHFESQLKERMSQWLWTRFATGALLMALGVSWAMLDIKSRSVLSAKNKNTTIERSLANTPNSTDKLNSKTCQAGSKEVCDNKDN